MAMKSVRAQPHSMSGRPSEARSGAQLSQCFFLNIGPLPGIRYQR